MSIGLQYLIVFVILAGIIGWIIYKMLFSAKKKEGGGCCGCALSEKCAKPNKKGRKDDCF